MSVFSEDEFTEYFVDGCGLVERCDLERDKVKLKLDKEGRYVIEECRFCGNKTKLDIVAEYSKSDEVSYNDEIENRDVEEWISNTDWMIVKCCVCNQISIATDYIDRNLVQVDQSYFSIVYPHRTYSSYHMPENIYKAYEVALKARYLDGSLCLLSLRRTLEIICKQQGETSGNLVRKIENLANKGILPSVLKDASDIVRDLGNAAAHGDNVEFSNSKVNQMIRFVESIIEYIYILPEKIKKLQNPN